ncbi:MAG: helix-turn-helix domain-containing protein [bacterium]|nr:helix-turn-helix domain-containing protein [bacterium]
MEEKLLSNPNSEGWLSIGEAAKYLRVSKDTLRRWEKEKIIKAYRSPTNHRYYKAEELDLIFNKRPDIEYSGKSKNGTTPKPSSSLSSKNIEWHFFIIVTLLSLYAVLMIFLIWLLI